MAYGFEGELKGIIASCGQAVDIGQIDENTDLVRDFGFGSINVVLLVAELESAFGIEINDESLTQERLTRYAGLVDILKEKLRGE